ncbi:MAG: zf-HC2 domain-containing protein [Thermodesulfobacteriota bacterium]
MDCTHCQDHFSELADQTLDPATIAHVEHHLGACGECAREYGHFVNTVALLRRMELREAPADLLAVIHRRLRGEEQSPLQRFLTRLRSFDFLSMSLPTATATVAVAVLAMLFVKNMGDRYQEPQLAAQPPTLSPAVKVNDADPGRQKSVVDGLLVSQHLADVYSLFSNGMLPYTNGAELNFRTVRHLPLLTSPPHLASSALPDAAILVACESRQQRFNLCRRLMNSQDWQTQLISADTLLLSLDTCKLDRLSKLLATHSVAVSPTSAMESIFAVPRKTITVAIRLD